MAAAISISAVKITASPWNINFDNEADVEDYIIVKDTGDNATAFTGFYNKTGGGSLLTMSEHDPDNQCVPFYESKNYRTTATDTNEGSLVDHARAITIADFSATNQVSGVKVVAPADTAERTVKIYAAMYASDAAHLSADVIATLNDGSGVTSTFALDGVSGVTHNADQYLEITVTFSADSDASSIDILTVNTPDSASVATVAMQAHAAYVTTESAPTIYTLDTTAGSYTYTGTTALLQSLHELIVAAGAYVLAGAELSFVKAYLLNVTAGVFTGNYQAATTLYQRMLGVVSGAYSLSGASSKINVLREMATTAGSYAKSGVSAGLNTINKIAAGVGSYSLSTFDVDVQAQRLMSALSGSYSHTGSAADTSRTTNGYLIRATAGNYALRGTTTYLYDNTEPSKKESVFIAMRRKGRR